MIMKKDYHILPTFDVVFLLGSDTPIEPVLSIGEPYGRYHIWADRNCYHWGVEIEARYIGLDDEKSPKVRECSHIPPMIHEMLRDRLPILGE